MQRAVCLALVNRSLEPVLHGLYGRPPPDEVHERIHDGLNARAREFYRGEVWPLRGVFGVLSRFPAGTGGGDGGKVTPKAVTTWMTDAGTIACSCVRRVAFSARHGEAPVDETCQHAKTFRGASSYLAARLGVSLAVLRRTIPRIFEDDDCPEGAAKASNDADIKPNWDAESIIETFRTGQTAAAVVLSGTGMCKVPAPVRCLRKTSSCEFCDSAAGFSCVHAVRARSVRHGEPPNKVAAAGAGGATGDDGETAVDDAQSTLPLPLHNCLLSVRVDAKVCAYMREGKVLSVPAPLRCPTCGTPRKKDTVKVDDGAVMCSEGYTAMGMESFFCSSDECQRWVFPDGRAEGLVILSCSTALMALIMRDMASEMVLSGSPFKACLKHWNNQFMDRRDSGAFPKMLPVKLKSRKTITALFFLTLELMTKEPPLWAFKCGTCQDEDGRFRIVMADGIWLGYLKRLASARYASPAEVCTSVRDGVRAASIHPTEWVRRFLRMTLKQPAKATFIKGVQLNSAKRALAFLCPMALPHVLETELPEDRRTQLVRLRNFLGLLRDLERATLPLVKGIVTRTKKLLSARGTMRPAVLETHQLTLQRLHAWLVHVEEADAGGVVAAGGISGAGNGGGDGAIADGGLHDDGEAEDEDGDVGAAPDQPPPAMPAVVPVAAAGANETRGRAAGPNTARRPAAAARSHHVARSTNEPLDPRCLRPRIKALGASLYRDITSFAIAVTIDPVVNACKPRHVGAIKKLADVLQAADGFAQVQDLKRRVALVTDAPLPPATPDAQENAPEPVAAETS
eukprot:contig_8762_g2063